MVDKNGIPQRNAEWKPEQKARMFRIAKANKIPVFGMTSNYSNEVGDFESTRMSSMLADPARRSAHISALVEIARADGLDGIDLDYESLKATDRGNYPLFIKDLADRLHKIGKRLSVTIHPKTEEPGTWDGTQALDYKAIGAAGDVVRIMCYDFSWSTSPAGAIAPSEWVRRVMEFSKSLIPANKLEIGVPCYGYDWSTKPAKSITSADLAGLGEGKVDLLSGELMFKDGVIRFGGKDSTKDRLDLAKKLGVRGITFWYLGSEESHFWELFPPSK